MSDPAQPTDHPQGVPPRPPQPGPVAQPAYPAQPRHTQPAYPAQPQHTQPGYPAPPQYAQPAPYAAPYTVPRPPLGGVPTPPAPAQSGLLGLAALILSVLATVGATVIAAIASWQIGLGAGRAIVLTPTSSDLDWSVLSPVREYVLTGEVSFWIGTVLGITALVLGIIAVVQRRGRVPGAIAAVLAAIGPIVFFAAVAGSMSTAISAGTGIGG